MLVALSIPRSGEFPFYLVLLDLIIHMPRMMTFIGTCALLWPVLGSAVNEELVQFYVEDVEDTLKTPAFVLELQCIPYSTAFEYPCASPHRTLRVLIGGRAYSIAVGTTLSVVGPWIYSTCYGCEDGLLFDVGEAGVLKIPRIVFGGKFQGDEGTLPECVDIESICSSVSRDRIWSAELMFPSELPHEVMGWWDVDCSMSSTPGLYRMFIHFSFHLVWRSFRYQVENVADDIIGRYSMCCWFVR